MNIVKLARRSWSDPGRSLPTRTSSLPQGQCASCGFLAKRTIGTGVHGSLRDPRYYEVEEDQREVPERAAFFIGDTLLGEMQMEFVCYVGATSLRHEIASEQTTANVSPAAAAWSVFHKDRRCPHWYAHEIGLDPHEHRRMLIARQVENERREFDRRMEESRKEFLLRIDTLAAQRETLAQQRNESLMQMAVVVGVFGVLAALLAALVAAGPGSIGFMALDRIFHVSPMSPPIAE